MLFSSLLEAKLKKIGQQSAVCKSVSSSLDPHTCLCRRERFCHALILPCLLPAQALEDGLLTRVICNIEAISPATPCEAALSFLPCIVPVCCMVMHCLKEKDKACKSV